jgi:hypothetical protein
MITYNKIGLNGRLGNQMFQYATLYAIAKTRKYEFGVPYESKNENADKTADINSRRDTLTELFDDKKEITRDVLLLKSAFSVIDQMFHKEIENAQIMKDKCCLSLFYKLFGCNLILQQPESLNSFIEELMDPFKEFDETPKYTLMKHIANSSSMGMCCPSSKKCEVICPGKKI